MGAPDKATTRGELLRGLRNGLIVALALFASIGGVVAALTVGRPFLFGATLTPGGALTLGALVGAVVAIGYFVLGTAVLLLGLLRRPSPRWVTRDSWLVTPVVAVLAVAALGFASGVGEYANRPITRAGMVSLTVEGADIGRLVADGQAQCILHDGTDLVVRAGAVDGETAVTTLQSADGRPLGIWFALQAGVEPGLSLAIGDRTAVDGRSTGARLDLAPGASRFAGTLDFSGLSALDPGTGEPLPGADWRGTLAWQCQF
jgi:hypothetical protein